MQHIMDKSTVSQEKMQYKAGSTQLLFMVMASMTGKWMIIILTIRVPTLQCTMLQTMAYYHLCPGEREP